MKTRTLADILFLIACFFLGITHLQMNGTPMENGHLVIGLLMFATAVIPFNGLFLTLNGKKFNAKN